MKTFAGRTAIFSCLVLLVLAAAEIYVERLPNPYRDKHAWMKSHADEVETLVLGSSHTYYGVCPEDLGHGAMSLANVSQTYRYDLYLLTRYEMPRLRNVILPFSYFSLWEDFESQGEDNYIIPYRIYMDCDLHCRWGRYGLECLSLPSFKEKLKSLWQPRRMYWSERGWGTEYTLAARNEDWDNGALRAAQNTYDDTTIYEANLERLNAIAQWCTARDVSLLLVETPVMRSFLSNMDERQNAANERALQSLISRYPKVTLVDLRADSRFCSRDFYDGDHLNSDGAHKLSGILKEYLLR